jgi:hypothetical protein
MVGEHEKSIQYYERAMQLSPLDTSSLESYAGISFPYFFLGRLRPGLSLGRAGTAAKAALYYSFDVEGGCIGNGRFAARQSTGRGSASEVVYAPPCVDLSDHAPFSPFPTR